MENKNENRAKGFGSKVGEFLKKLYHFRFRVDRKGEPIVNVSSIFALGCLFFAPHMTLAGIVVSLLLGYQIRFENEAGDNAELQEQIRKTVQNVKAGATNAAKSIRKELDKVRTENAGGNAGPAVEKTVDKGAEKAVEKTQDARPSNEDLLQELKAYAEESVENNPNPASTTFHSAYSASAGTVPVLKVHENDPGTVPEVSGSVSKGGEE